MSLTRVALAGSTGSIGTQALEVIDAESEHFELTALGATGRQPDVIIEQARRYRPAVVAISDPGAALYIAAELPGVDVRGGARHALLDDTGQRQPDRPASGQPGIQIHERIQQARRR